MNKALIGTAVGMGLLLVTSVPALAANSTTGANSRNWSVQLDAKVAALKLKNFGIATQNTTTSSTTGGNTSNMNTSNAGGGVQAGKANATGDVGSMLNDNTVGVNQSACDCVSSAVAGNEITGYDSTNVSIVANVKLAAIKIKNVGIVTQTTNTSANSGGNQANQNTIGGSVITGDATASSTVVSAVNTNNVTITQ